MYFKKLFKAIFNISEISNDKECTNSNVIQSIKSPRFNGDNDIYMYQIDTHNFSLNTNGTFIVYNNGDDEEEDSNESKSNNKKSKRIPIKPKDVLNELERIPSSWSLLNINDKIEVLKDKLSLITQRYALEEVNHLLMCLENRKKYFNKDSSGQIYKDFFSKFDITNKEKIDVLLNKYELCMKSADIFIPEFPKEAIDIMKIFTTKVNELCSKRPHFMVIATEDSFQKSYEKRDPILLAQSPFGLYYHILGAWDEEMILLNEL
jgi:hypothetical protein